MNASAQSPLILLCDNGSKAPAATLMLRQIAADLSQSSGRTVHPVSLQHAGSIDPSLLGGQPARVMPEFLSEQLEQGQRRFLVLPLFFGNSRALTSFIPQQQEILSQQFGEFEIEIAEVLYPLPDGDDQLRQVLQSNIETLNAPEDYPVVLVDHGTPAAAVNQVRQSLAQGLNEHAMVKVEQACMERREGEEYDFNGQLLADWLRDKAKQGASGAAIAMLFLLPGRHAGEGGDVAEICADAVADYPGFEVQISPLVSENPLLIEMLDQRLQRALPT